MDHIYSELYARYSNTLEEHNNLLIKIVSVTDNILRSQYQKEYAECADKLKIIQLDIQEFEPKYLKYKTLEWCNEFYLEYFYASNLQDVLERQGLNLTQFCRDKRMRPITSLNQKRELTYLLNDLRKQIHVCDYQDTLLETIGKYDDGIYTVHVASIGELTDVVIQRR